MLDNTNFSEVIDKFKTILKEKDIDINQVFSDEASQDSSDFNIDINTILTFKKILSKFNNTNNARNHLLYSLKPFLRPSRQQKLDEYIRLANVLGVLALLNEHEGDEKNETG